MIHKDLAARNILLTKHMTAKIADFGLSHGVGEESEGGVPLPKLWTAPEILFQQGKPSHKSDVWSLGVVMWEIFTYGQRPYRGDPFKRDESISDQRFVKFINEGNTMSTPKQIFKEEEFSQNIDTFFHEFIRSVTIYTLINYSCFLKTLLESEA